MAAPLKEDRVREGSLILHMPGYSAAVAGDPPRVAASPAANALISARGDRKSTVQLYVYIRFLQLAAELTGPKASMRWAIFNSLAKSAAGGVVSDTPKINRSPRPI